MEVQGLMMMMRKMKQMKEVMRKMHGVEMQEKKIYHQHSVDGLDSMTMEMKMGTEMMMMILLGLHLSSSSTSSFHPFLRCCSVPPMLR